MARLTHLECTRCGQSLPADRPQTICPKDGGVSTRATIFPTIKKTFSREQLCDRPATMWRYAEVLPEAQPVSLGEGFTPMLPSREYPNGSHQRRRAESNRIVQSPRTVCRHHDGEALRREEGGDPLRGKRRRSAWRHTPPPPVSKRISSCRKMCPWRTGSNREYYGAHVTLVDGLISDCARMVAERKEKEGWFDVSTLKEPYRVEGKKTMGYEVAEQLGWRLPARNHLSDRRRRRPDRHVEGLRRDGEAGLDRLRAPKDGHRAVSRLRPNC